jgi:hypothetical protein
MEFKEVIPEGIDSKGKSIADHWWDAKGGPPIIEENGMLKRIRLFLATRITSRKKTTTKLPKT